MTTMSSDELSDLFGDFDSRELLRLADEIGIREGSGIWADDLPKLASAVADKRIDKLIDLGLSKSWRRDDT